MTCERGSSVNWKTRLKMKRCVASSARASERRGSGREVGEATPSADF